VATRDDSGRASRHDDEVKSLTAQVSFLDEEIAVLRRRLIPLLAGAARAGPEKADGPLLAQEAVVVVQTLGGGPR
jgi:hypothetical protein